MTDVDQTKISRDLGEILLLEPSLLAQAVNTANATIDQHSLPGGLAMVSLAPVARLSRWNERIFELEQQWELAHPDAPIDDRPDWTVDEDDSWEPVLQTLRWWSDRYRRALSMQYDMIPTIATEAAFLRHESVLNWVIANEPKVEHFAKDINRARRRLENVVHAGDRSERSRVVCSDCPAVDSMDESGDEPQPPPRLIKVYGSTPEADRWKCPRCKRRYDGEGLRAAHAKQLRHESAARYVPLVEARATLVSQGTAERTIRKWMSPRVVEVDVCTVCRRRYERQEYAACPRKIMRRKEWTGDRCGGELIPGWHGDREAVVNAYCEIATHRVMVWWPDLWSRHLVLEARKRLARATA